MGHLGRSFYSPCLLQVPQRVSRAVYHNRIENTRVLWAGSCRVVFVVVRVVEKPVFGKQFLESCLNSQQFEDGILS